MNQREANLPYRIGRGGGRVSLGSVGCTAACRANRGAWIQSDGRGRRHGAASEKSRAAKARVPARFK